MASSKFFKVLALPSTLVANAFYAVGKTGNLVDLYVVNSAGTIARKLDPTDDVIATMIATGTTAPAPASTKAVFWWNPNTGTLFYRYNNSGNPQWVEAMPSQVVPQFAGNGTANTMSHSDHYHTTLDIESQW